MKIKEPCCITPRLLAGIQIGQGKGSISWISIDYAPIHTIESRTHFKYFIDIPGFSHESDDISCHYGNLQTALGTLLAFLGAAAESYRYEMNSDNKSENSDLFPSKIMEWAYQNSDEIGMFSCELEETENLIDETE